MVIRAATKKRSLSLEEFLALPETKPASELIDGEVVQKPMARIRHNRPIMKLIRILDRFEATSAGEPLTEQGTNFPNNHRVPDLSWFAPGRLAGLRDYPDFAPDLAVEVLSKGQTKRSQRERLQFLRDNGSRATLLIDPEDETIEVHDGTRTFVARGDEAIVLESIGGLSFTPNQIFAS